MSFKTIAGFSILSFLFVGCSTITLSFRDKTSVTLEAPPHSGKSDAAWKSKAEWFCNQRAELKRKFVSNIFEPIHHYSNISEQDYLTGKTSYRSQVRTTMGLVEHEFRQFLCLNEDKAPESNLR